MMHVLKEQDEGTKTLDDKHGLAESPHTSPKEYNQTIELLS